jgi:hypothetical protein
MNFSTTPPTSSILRRDSAKYRSSSVSSSSGSSRSPMFVDPTTSQKSPVMILRSASGPRADRRSAPHSLQNFASSGRFAPQLGQRMASTLGLRLSSRPRYRQLERSAGLNRDSRSVEGPRATREPFGAVDGLAEPPAGAPSPHRRRGDPELPGVAALAGASILSHDRRL